MDRSASRVWPTRTCLTTIYDRVAAHFDEADLVALTFGGHRHQQLEPPLDLVPSYWSAVISRKPWLSKTDVASGWSP